MTSFLQTTQGGEGATENGEMHRFFDQNSKLKLEWAEKLKEHGLDLDDLMDSEKDDLRETLNDVFADYQHKATAIIKIINAVKRHPDSEMYKQANATKVSVVSTEEYESSGKLQAESAKMTEAAQRAGDVMEALSANSQHAEKLIRDTFDGIAESAQKRRDVLLLRLQEIADSKLQKLKAQKTGFEERVKRLDDAYEKTVRMMKDTEVDPIKRTIKIAQQAQEMLEGDQMDVKLVTNDSVVVEVDVSAIKDAISRMGSVLDGNCALPPTVTV